MWRWAQRFQPEHTYIQSDWMSIKYNLYYLQSSTSSVRVSFNTPTPYTRIRMTMSTMMTTNLTEGNVADKSKLRDSMTDNFHFSSNWFYASNAACGHIGNVAATIFSIVESINHDGFVLYIYHIVNFHMRGDDYLANDLSNDQISHATSRSISTNHVNWRWTKAWHKEWWIWVTSRPGAITNSPLPSFLHGVTFNISLTHILRKQLPIQEKWIADDNYGSYIYSYITWFLRIPKRNNSSYYSNAAIFISLYQIAFDLHWLVWKLLLHS